MIRMGRLVSFDSILNFESDINFKQRSSLPMDALDSTLTPVFFKSSALIRRM